jgi:hypothetical protein
MRSRHSFEPALPHLRVALRVLAAVSVFAVACGPKAPPGSATLDTAPHQSPTGEAEGPLPSAAAPEPLVWLAWRQDAGGMAATTLIVDGRRGQPLETLEVNRALLTSAGDDVWSLSPLAERWGLSPCGEEGVGIARGLRYRSLGPGVGKKLPGDALEHRWSTEGRRPAPGDSATHEEVLVFSAQVGHHVLLRHITRGDTCPVPAGSIERIGLHALDLRRGVLVSTLEAISDDTRRSVIEKTVDEAARRVAAERPELVAAAIADKLRLEDVEIRETPGGRQVHAVFIGDDPIFTRIDVPGGMGPDLVRVRVPVSSPLPELAVGHVPAPIRAFWAAREAFDATRTEGVSDASFYGGVGWVQVPYRLEAALRKALMSIRDAPTPDGPSDWD